MSESRFYKRFPAQRRTWCVSVTGARSNEAKNGSQQARAVGQASGTGVSPKGSGPAPVDLNIKRIKGVVEK
jgi:hypothetical protein